jgi:hypothetical protein
MRIKFEYNGIEYYPKNPDKKLQELGITWDDVRIIDESKKKPVEIIQERNDLYYFINNKGESITSIYNIVPTGYKPTSLENLKRKWTTHKMSKSIEMLNEIWDNVIEYKLQNSQETLDWLDSLNEISVRN